MLTRSITSDCIPQHADFGTDLLLSSVVYHVVAVGITSAAAAADLPEAYKLCCTGRCSVYEFCLSAVTTTSNTPPTITLRTTAAAPVTTTIKLGYHYTACAPGQQPYKSAECELGATALDAQSGNLTASVLVCAPATCTTSSCASGEASGHLQQCF